VISTAGLSGAQWTDITPFGLKGADSDGTMGVTTIDIDSDGDDDLVVANGGSGGGPTKLYLNDGAGNFTNATTGIFAENHNVWSPIFGDMDNDGDPDLFMIAFGEQCRLYENLGDGSFVELPNNGLWEQAGNMMARGGAWVDFDADGLLDIMVSTNAAKQDVGRDKLYRNMGNNVFEDVSPDIFDALNIGRGVAWCDFDNDGDVDLYTVGGKGCPCDWEDQPEFWLERAENRMYRNDGGVFTDVTNDVTKDILHGRGVAAGDYDNDGDLDLYICNVGVTGEEGKNPETMGGPNRLLRNDGDFQFTDVTPLVLQLNGGERSCAWFDMDNDGDLDLILTTMWVGGQVVGLIENINAGESFVMHWYDEVLDDIPFRDNSGTGCGITDIDDDGDLDVMLAYKFGPNLLARNDLDNQNHWLKIRLEGTVSNRSAIGAHIEVRAGNLVQIREVQTGNGYWSQHSLVQHFGLATHEVVDEIVVTWPSGIVQTISSPQIDATLDITEELPQCSHDLNNDGSVNVMDILILIGDWGKCKQCASDLNADGIVQIDDLLLLIGAWGDCL
jgi:hypothetical protein